jgi:aldehyde dehydrogenase (NAD+)
VQFGGGCINNTLIHLGNPELPFGGTGNSGVGAYHGKYSFEVFTRPKSIVNTATWLDPSLKYPPYKGKLKLLRWLFK